MRQKRPFYIIGHNPNTIEEATEFLSRGANALEPDVWYADGQYYVSHDPHIFLPGIATLEGYLADLKKLIHEKNYPLSLLVFDCKESDFDINDFISVVKENFNGGACDGVAISVTHADDIEFLKKYNSAYPDVGVGTDESDVPPQEIEIIFKDAGIRNMTYADGITTFLSKTGVFENVTAAEHCRYERAPDSFGVVYTWVLSLGTSMRKYLGTFIDGVMVDAGDVDHLREMLSAPPFDEVYELAPNGHNPFTAAPLPSYHLTVKTMDHYLAGTDANILFTIVGDKGELKSLPYNGSLYGELERNSTTTITLEGLDVGEIKSITVEALTSDINSDWLPEYIEIRSRLLTKKVTVVYNGDGIPEHWISKKSGPVTKYVISE